jgi:tRNA-2-methylthio-N6-dimethylallyladenosine synthase
MTKRLWIETVGCQMNVLDSELVVAALRRQGGDHARAEAWTRLKAILGRL